MARVLVVDDSISMRRNLKIILTQAGHNVVAEAADGMHAYLEYEKNNPDLVTMDITMPRLNGIDSVKKIIAKFPEARIIMISALDQRNMVFEALKSGAKHYILKPVTPDKVLNVVNDVLKQEETNVPEPATTTEEVFEESSIKPEHVIMPFSIENNNGIFVININDNMNTDTFNSLGGVIQGFLFIRPLKVVFNFAGNIGDDKNFITRVLGFIKSIQNAGGELKLVSSSEQFIQSMSTLAEDSTLLFYESINSVKF